MPRRARRCRIRCARQGEKKRRRRDRLRPPHYRGVTAPLRVGGRTPADALWAPRWPRPRRSPRPLRGLFPGSRLFLTVLIPRAGSIAPLVGAARGARARDRPAPAPLAREVRGRGAVPTGHAGAAPRASGPIGGGEVPAPEAGLGGDRVDHPRPAGHPVELAGRVDRPGGPRLGPVDVPLVDDAACPGAQPPARPLVGRGADQAAWRVAERRHGLAPRVIAQEGVPDARRAVGRERRLVAAGRRVIAVAHPDADGERGRIRVAWRREVSVGGQVARVVGRARLHRGRPPFPARPVADLQRRTPQQVLRGVRVAFQDVRDLERGLGADGARPLRLARVVDGRAVGARDPEHHPRRHAHALVAERPEGGDEVEQPHLDGTDAAGQAGHEHRSLAARELDAESLRVLGDGLRPDAAHRLDGRDVERVLERLANEDRAPLAAIGVARRPAAREGCRDVHEKGRGRHATGLEAGGVDDRLEGGAGLAEADPRHVVFRVELAGSEVLPVVAGAAHVGQDVACPVVDRRHGAVVQVASPEPGDPGLIAAQLLSPDGGAHRPA